MAPAAAPITPPATAPPAERVAKPPINAPEPPPMRVPLNWRSCRAVSQPASVKAKAATINSLGPQKNSLCCGRRVRQMFWISDLFL